MKKVTIINKIDEKKKQWQSEHIMNTTSPWSYFALSESDSGKGSYWLNPYTQELLDSGWYSEEQLQNWLEGNPHFLKKKHTFTDLMERCEVGYLTGAYLDKYISMNHFKPNYGEKFSKEALQSKSRSKIKPVKFNEQLIKEIEQTCKYFIYDYFKYARVETLIKNNFTLSKEYEAKITYFFECLYKMGFGYWGACNTPIERENLSFYKDFLIHEVQREVYKNKRYRKYKDMYFIMEQQSTDTMNVTIQYDNITFPRTLELSTDQVGEPLINFHNIWEPLKNIVDNKNVAKILKDFKKQPSIYALSCLHEFLGALK